MDFFKKLKKTEGGYIFLSHSHKDIDKVRKIRNMLEEDGFEPLCFYLKCLNDDCELEDLIKREIDAREWFIFINSINSQESKWVQLEREHITKTNSKKILTIDLDDKKSIHKIREKLKHNLRIFMAYSAKDTNLARKIKTRFEAKDYQVFFTLDSIPVGSNYETIITDAITQASQAGCVIVLLTENSMHSDFVIGEMAFARKKKGNIIPVRIGNIELDDLWSFYLATTQIYELSTNPSEDEIDIMINKIGQYIVEQ